MGAGVAHGEGAHLLEVNEGGVAVVPARCDAARSTHLPAGAAHTIVSKAFELEGPDLPRSLTRGEAASSCEHNRYTTGEWSHARVSAPRISGAPGGQSGGLNHPSHAKRVLESRQRETKLPQRLTKLDAVAPRCVLYGGLACSEDPARRRGKSAAEAPLHGLDRKFVRQQRGAS